MSSGFAGLPRSLAEISGGGRIRQTYPTSSRGLFDQPRLVYIWAYSRDLITNILKVSTVEAGCRVTCVLTVVRCGHLWVAKTHQLYGIGRHVQRNQIYHPCCTYAFTQASSTLPCSTLHSASLIATNMVSTPVSFNGATLTSRVKHHQAARQEADQVKEERRTRYVS
jgi:hypothetical protein